MSQKNFGLLESKVGPRDWIFGSNTPLRKEGQENVLADWTPYLPVKEKQKFCKDGQCVEPMSCTNHSANNCLEIMHKFKYGKEINLSDCQLAKTSGTTKWGNYLYKVADHLMENGVVYEHDWPYPYDGAKYTWEDYYREIPAEVLNKRKMFKEKYTVNHEWVEKKDFKEALRYGPLQVTGYAWYKGAGDMYYRLNGKKDNHALTMIKAETEHAVCWDTYANSKGEHIKKVAWDNIGDWAKFYSINHENKPMEFKNNKIYKARINIDRNDKESPKKMVLGFILDGRMMMNESEEDKFNVYLEAIARGASPTDIETISQEDWYSVEHINLKKVNLKGEEL